MSMAGRPALSAVEGGRRERAKAANRQAILNAARRVFQHLGYDATSVRDIIRGTDLASGTFYNYFRSKEEVFEALQDDGARRFRPLLRETMAKAANFEDFIVAAFAAYFRFVAEEHAHGMAPPGAVHVDTPEMVAVFEEVRGAIAAAIARGDAPAMNPDYFAAAAIGMAREVGLRMVLTQPHDVAGAAAFCARLTLFGMNGATQDAAGGSP